jgi:hypothetical protein
MPPRTVLGGTKPALGDQQKASPSAGEKGLVREAQVPRVQPTHTDVPTDCSMTFEFVRLSGARHACVQEAWHTWNEPSGSKATP